MIGYIVGICFISIFVSIITEHLVLRRMRLDKNVTISKGRCVCTNNQNNQDNNIQDK